MPDRITKFIRSLDDKTRKKLKKNLLALKKDPFKAKNVKKLKNYPENAYRFRMGKIRIIYQINQEGVEIIDIDYRGNIY